MRTLFVGKSTELAGFKALGQDVWKHVVCCWQPGCYVVGESSMPPPASLAARSIPEHVMGLSNGDWRRQ
jgi:hypothetical protein